jgi:aminopeptidase YwaD
MPHAAAAADVAALAAPALAGRAAGSLGAARAGRHLASRLAALGWQPAGVRGWTEPVEVAGAWLRATPELRIGERRLRHRRDFAAAPGASGRFAGTLRPLTDAPLAAETIAGAALLLAERPAGLALPALAAAAARHGAAALLVEDDDAPWRRKAVAAEPHPLPVLHLRRELAHELVAGEGSPVVGEIALDRRPRRCANLLAVLPAPPGAPTVALTAHFDHLGDDPDGVRFPGAFDNASGAAALLSAAERLARTPPPGVRLLCAFLTGEESGLWGARRLAARGDLAAVLNLDGVGAAPRLARLRLGSTDAGEPLVALALPLLAARGIEPVFTAERDDALAFRRAGIPVLGLGEEPRRGLPFLHTPDDLPERLHGAAIADAGALVAELAVAIARTLADARGWIPGSAGAPRSRSEGRLP